MLVLDAMLLRHSMTKAEKKKCMLSEQHPLVEDTDWDWLLEEFVQVPVCGLPQNGCLDMDFLFTFIWVLETFFYASNIEGKVGGQFLFLRFLFHSEFLEFS